MKHDYMIKLILVGNSNTGKSHFFHLLTENPTDGILSTVGVDFALIYHTINDKHFCINLWDTAGQERFNCLVNSYFRNINGFILFFNVNESSSFYALEQWMNKIKDQNNCNHDHPMILIGNKNDLSHKVNQHDIIEFTEKYNLIYVEISLKKNNVNVKDILEILVSKIYKTLIKSNGQSICSNVKSYKDYHNTCKRYSLTTKTISSNNKEIHSKKNWLNQMYKYFCFL